MRIEPTSEQNHKCSSVTLLYPFISYLFSKFFLRMFYLTGWSTSLWTTAFILLLTIVVWFLTLISTIYDLTLIWVDFLVVRFEVGWVKVHPCLKLVRVMLETWNLVRNYRHIWSFRKYTFCTKNPLILMIQHFLLKIVPLLRAIVLKSC